MKSISIVQYSSKHKDEWDSLISKAKNSPFFAKRDFMEYHADRYQDFSFLAEFDGKFIAAVPASINKERDTVISHAGLTFGGIFVHQSLKTPTYLRLFREIIIYLHKNKIRKFIYKVPPTCYHKTPSEEDVYAIHLHGGKLFRRDIGTILNPESLGEYSNLRKRMIKKGKDLSIEISETDNFELFWPLLEDVLQNRHGVSTVHTLKEITYLKRRCEGNIRLFLAIQKKNILAGTVIFESDSVAHAQYIASSELGKKNGALDLIFNHLIKNEFKNKKWFSFGISSENSGKFINEGLIRYKESFGGGSCIFDFYEINVEDSFNNIKMDFIHN
jgi:hypothetical protein